MKKIKYLLTAICAIALLPACLKDFQDLNTNPEVLGDADPVNVFTGATRDFNDTNRHYLTGKYSTMVLMQYLVGSGGASDGVYNNLSANRRSAPHAPWYNDYYQADGNGGAYGLRLNYLVNNIIPIQDNPEKYGDLVAISNILLAYKQWQILDTYGAAPITEAFQAVSGNYAPRYDLYQESVDGEPMYKVIDQHLKEAVAALKASDETQVKLGSNDFFYEGDVAKWIKAGNTLRVKMAQRLEKRDAAFYNEVLNEVLTSADNIISSHDESLIYKHGNNYNDDTNDIAALTYSYVASAAFVNYLTEYNDPRLPIMVRRNGFGDGNNNKANDTWFNRFIGEYPDYQLGRKIENDSVVMDLTPFTARYVGMTANPANSGYSISSVVIGKELSNVTYYPVDDEGVKAETPSSMSIRMYSQFESRFFVKNGGAASLSTMPARDVEDEDRFRVTPSEIACINPILTYPETCFMLAEIAFKKNASVAGKDATTWYRQGIRAAMEQVRAWGERMKVSPLTNDASDVKATLTDAQIEAYLAQPEFQTASLEKIISQQWVNLFMQPEEMWATWKRTGLPAFKAGRTTEFDIVDNNGAFKEKTTGIFLGPKPEGGVAFFEEISGGDNAKLEIPRRNSLGAPNSLNEDNWKAAIEKLKADAQYGSDFDRTEGRIWWDKE